MFIVATANAPIESAPVHVRSTMPLLFGVAASATTSGTGVAEAENRSVLTPGKSGTKSVLAHLKFNGTSVGATGASGVNPKASLRDAPGAISTGKGKSHQPLSKKTKEKIAGIPAGDESQQPVADCCPVLITVATAVADPPT
jgi:hypothetical protein